MNWYNEPREWKYKEGKLTFDVTPGTDYWRITHYGFIVDDGPFIYTERGGEFEVTVRITGKYRSRYDQMGLMFRINEKTWIKTGIEFVDDVYNLSTVVTDEFSNWSVIPLQGKHETIWLKAIRRSDAIEIFYSLNGREFLMSNVVHFHAHVPAKVGMMAASPEGDGFKAVFEDFNIKHLPDSDRMKWAENN